VTENPSWIASKRFDEAFALARRGHRTQARKIDNEPYIGHLLGVSSLIIEYGGDEDQAIAGLLHDLIEDTDTTAEEIAEMCGSRVAKLVDKCTEATKRQKELDKKKSNYKALRRKRKQAYIDALRDKDKHDDSILVALADKVNNAEKTARDIKIDRRIFDNFNAGYKEQKWWYESLVDAFGTKVLGGNVMRDRLYERLQVAVNEIFAPRARPTQKRTTPAKKGNK
jgi:(p)ppGpp synthase/HD superfamily hydrolase